MIRFRTQLCRPVEEALANIASAKASGLPFLSVMPEHGRPLAIVGGGPSARIAIGQLKHFDGDVWGINGACAWLAGHGIEATFFAADPLPILADCIASPKRAILAACVDRAVMVKLLGHAEILFFVPAGFGTGDLPRVPNGPTAITNAIPVSLLMGYRDIHVYGCDSSYEGPTHVYDNAEIYASDLIVEACGHEYRTQPEYLMQAEVLEAMARSIPFLHMRCGGLTGALIRSGGEYRAVHIPDDIARFVEAA